jgi:hypothetical protein
MSVPLRLAQRAKQRDGRVAFPRVVFSVISRPMVGKAITLSEASTNAVSSLFTDDIPVGERVDDPRVP